ncbi:MAG: RluA family pseudouridine synthase [Candidatus Omnitrophica bacterium]|nr:RluA family pseudouridine synthase [Candidatus Omnitrophota bacterium]MDD4012750.1 RluA family pseudouridine synthase [Candidatus Omnitrophota bacterium]
MDNLNFIIAPEEAGKRVDKVITARLGEGYSRVFAQTLIRKRLVLINGKPAKASYPAELLDEVSVTIPPAEKNDLRPEDIPLKILYEDASVVVIDKPAGIVVHPGCGNMTGTVVNALLYHCGNLPEADGEMRPGIVHRLDKDTSGVMVVAKNDRALRSLSKQFQNRTVKKRYIAVVRGEVPLDSGVIEAPIARSSSDRKKMGVEFERGKNAVTKYKVIKRMKTMTVLSVDIETGRTHQIRVHMKHIGHPVAGDPVYGKAQEAPRQALHAEMLSFTNPENGKTMEFTAPLPEDMKKLIEGK